MSDIVFYVVCLLVVFIAIAIAACAKEEVPHESFEAQKNALQDVVIKANSYNARLVQMIQQVKIDQQEQLLANEHVQNQLQLLKEQTKVQNERLDAIDQKYLGEKEIVSLLEGGEV